MRVLPILVFVGLGPSGVAVAHADSDGYYCIGRGYLAYQFGMDVPTNPPRVSIIGTSTPGVVPRPLELKLPPFQVHGMRCGEGWVDVAAFNTVYRIVLDDSNRPLRYEVRALPAWSGRFADFLPTRNLAKLSRAASTLTTERVPLSEAGDGTGFSLVITAKLKPPAARCLTSITTRLVETDRKGKELRGRVLFRGEGHRECGE